jgi:hypothetical protein
MAYQLPQDAHKEDNLLDLQEKIFKHEFYRCIDTEIDLMAECFSAD